MKCAWSAFLMRINVINHFIIASLRPSVRPSECPDWSCRRLFLLKHLILLSCSIRIDQFFERVYKVSDIIPFSRQFITIIEWKYAISDFSFFYSSDRSISLIFTFIFIFHSFKRGRNSIRTALLWISLGWQITLKTVPGGHFEVLVVVFVC